MTVYVTDCTFVGRFLLWGDTPDEGMLAAYQCGASMADINPNTPSWEHYRINDTQWAMAVGFGAKVVDRLEPSAWMARRAGDTEMQEKIAAARRHGIVTRNT